MGGTYLLDGSLMEQSGQLERIEGNLAFVDAIAKTRSVMSQYSGKNVVVSYSGGADSDVIMHLLRYSGFSVKGVMFDTGIEYKATHRHVDYMRSIGFDIEVIRIGKPIPTSQREHGSAFISKRVSGMLERLQKHNFDFLNDGGMSFEYLIKRYPKCRSALRWWVNDFDNSALNVDNNRYLKEFLVEYGLPFKVSGKCCDGAKKLPAKQYAKQNNIDLMILGIRKSERGQRSLTYENCFVDKGKRSYAMYFPMFWWSDADRSLFESILSIRHSEAYSVYGLKRTGCAGCPFGRDFENELSVMKEHEPKLHKGVCNIFELPHEWTRKYKAFAQQKKIKPDRSKDNQLSLFGIN